MYKTWNNTNIITGIWIKQIIIHDKRYYSCLEMKYAIAAIWMELELSHEFKSGEDQIPYIIYVQSIMYK